MSSAGSPIIRAIQGNFDHLMGAIRHIAEAHNLMNDDLLEMEGVIKIVQQVAENAGDDIAEHLADTTAPHDHGHLGGLGDDDHTQYLKEKASGGTAAEVPTHAHTGAAEAGTLDHGAALTAELHQRGARFHGRSDAIVHHTTDIAKQHIVARGERCEMSCQGGEGGGHRNTGGHSAVGGK